MSDKFYVGLDITSFADNGEYKPISRVTLLVDDENAFTAGDDTGRELLASCPFATQRMVDAMLAEVKGRKYRAYSAEAANIDPAAELGDGVTVNGVYSIISQISDDGSGYAGISAPGESELEDEYPVEGPATQEFTRKIAENYSLITKTAEEIRLEVGNKYTTKDEFSETTGQLAANITLTAGQIRQEVKKTYATQESLAATNETLKTTETTLLSEITLMGDRITLSVKETYTTKKEFGDATRLEKNGDGDVGTVVTTLRSDMVQTAKGITLSATKSETGNKTISSTLSLSYNGIAFDSAEISFDGLVTFVGLETGETSINGGWIRTGLIEAERLNLTGAITFNDFAEKNADGTAGPGEAINNAQSTADGTAAFVTEFATNLGGGEFSNGTFISGTKIYSPTIYADMFTVMPARESTSGWAGGYSLWGSYLGAEPEEMMRIYFYQGDWPVVIFEGVNKDAYTSWMFEDTTFYETVRFPGYAEFTGYVNFERANVTGLTATFG